MSDGQPVCLSQIKSGHIGDAVHPGLATKNVFDAVDGTKDRCVFVRRVCRSYSNIF
jgi:hypothetical protein